MIKSTLKWLIVIFFTFYCCVVYKYNNVFVLLIVLELLVGTIAFVFVLSLKITLKPRLQKIIGSTQKGKKVKVIINLSKKKRLGYKRYGNCRVVLKIKILQPKLLNIRSIALP